ncbi:hypothetical protein [Melittangium boletus]|uniref:Lipoprotein n=1 Tax=Melittangium boletus DSM 14713 TaxID=1294270 RepID=A0A250IDW4_9BACT|nr:hypothetical protein [Melittangium boletus]ATB29146.1 hypothetical protein MEBOL_002595 [Melittangium boletus DSM 14713]
MRRWMSLAVLSAGLLSACALRPYYRQVLPPDVSVLKPAQARGHEDVTLRMVEPGTNRPLVGAKVYLGTSRGRFATTSDAQGLVKLPVTAELLTENPLVEVIPPSDAKGYAFEVVKQD